MIANGFWISEPIPVEMTAGSKFIDPISVIISKARNRICTASLMASLPKVIVHFRQSIKI